MIGIAKKQAWLYLDAKGWMVSSQYAGEVAWTESLSRNFLTEEEFLKETAWVIFCSGFRESVVRKKFGFISLAFFDWLSADAIADDGLNCVRMALPYFKNEKKLKAIVQTAEILAEVGFGKFKKELMRDPLGMLQALPYIGPITSLHLAKNLGFQFAKPDRHLQRLADTLGFSGCDEMCEGFSSITGDSVAVVDTVLWRYCEQYATWPNTSLGS